MNARAVAFVLCRLGALYMIANYGLNLLVQMVWLLMSPDNVANSGSWLPILLGLGIMAGYVVIGLVLWSGAGWFARRIAMPFPESFRDDMGASQWQAFVISGTGWFTLVTAIRLVVSAIRSMADPSSQHQSAFLIVPLAIFIAAGVTLIVFPVTIVKGLNALRAWGAGVRDWANRPLIEDETP